MATIASHAIALPSGEGSRFFAATNFVICNRPALQKMRAHDEIT
jgi:hypothetical protein